MRFSFAGPMLDLLPLEIIPVVLIPHISNTFGIAVTSVKLKHDLNPFQIGIYVFLVNTVFGYPNFTRWRRLGALVVCVGRFQYFINNSVFKIKYWNLKAGKLIRFDNRMSRIRQQSILQL